MHISDERIWEELFAGRGASWQDTIQTCGKYSNSFENAEKNKAELDRNKLKQETSLYKIKTIF